MFNQTGFFLLFFVQTFCATCKVVIRRDKKKHLAIMNCTTSKILEFNRKQKKCIHDHTCIGKTSPMVSKAMVMTFPLAIGTEMLLLVNLRLF